MVVHDHVLTVLHPLFSTQASPVDGPFSQNLYCIASPSGSVALAVHNIDVPGFWGLALSGFSELATGGWFCAVMAKSAILNES